MFAMYTNQSTCSFFSIHRNGMGVFISLLALRLQIASPYIISGFPLEVVIGVRQLILGNNLDSGVAELKKIKKISNEVTCCPKTRFPHHPESLAHAVCLPLQEATDLFQDPDGRWFSFAINMDCVVILDKKELPSHLASLPCVETPTSLKDLFLQLEDSGEVCG